MRRTYISVDRHRSKQLESPGHAVLLFALVGTQKAQRNLCNTGLGSSANTRARMASKSIRSHDARPRYVRKAGLWRSQRIYGYSYTCVLF